MLDPVTIIIRGKHNTGRTTLSNLIKDALDQNEYRHVRVVDAAPLPPNQKPEYPERFKRNREERPVIIKVELEE